MFRSARIKLTAWYILVIMVICFFFSLAIYKGLESELQRRYINIGNELRVKILGKKVLPPLAKRILLEDFERAKQRVLINLLFANGFILVVSAFAGYFLAGRTLEPIEEMVEEQSRFVADASHELRTPLTAIKTSTEVALRDKKMNLKQAREVLKSNLEDVENLSILTDRLLSLTRYQKGTTNLLFEKVNIKKIIDSAYKKIAPLAKKRKISIKLDTQDNILKADKIGLEEMVMILIENAVKYTPEGGEIKVSTKTEGKYIVIKVKDTGIGIEKKDIPYIFNRFYRVDQSRSKMKVQGFGLGLPIAKSIVEMHKGSISVVSQPNRGTVFTVKIPLKLSQ